MAINDGVDVKMKARLLLDVTKARLSFGTVVTAPRTHGFLGEICIT